MYHFGVFRVSRAFITIDNWNKNNYTGDNDAGKDNDYNVENLITVNVTVWIYMRVIVIANNIISSIEIVYISSKYIEFIDKERKRKDYRNINELQMIFLLFISHHSFTRFSYDAIITFNIVVWNYRYRWPIPLVVYTDRTRLLNILDVWRTFDRNVYVGYRCERATLDKVRPAVLPGGISHRPLSLVLRCVCYTTRSLAENVLIFTQKKRFCFVFANRRENIHQKNKSI